MKKYKTRKEIAADSIAHTAAEMAYLYAKREFNFCMQDFKAAVGKFDGSYSPARDALFDSKEQLDAARAEYDAAAENSKVYYEL